MFGAGAGGTHDAIAWSQLIALGQPHGHRGGQSMIKGMPMRSRMFFCADAFAAFAILASFGHGLASFVPWMSRAKICS